MEYRKLGRTGLKISELCLGTMQFGWTADESTAFQVMDAYLEAGGNCLDTADVYSRWVEGNPGGVSEQIIGRWLKSRGVRRQIVLATKVRGRMWDGPNGEGLSRHHIMLAVEDSLRRLQTDYIDLYQVHWPDEETPLDETLRALDDLVHQGKVLYIGASNFPAWLLTRSLWLSDVLKIARFDSLQPHYNLVNRAGFERELVHVVQKFGLGVIPYSPLAGGFLTGKYRPDRPLPRTPRAERIQAQYFNERGFRVLEALDRVAQKHGKTPAQVALAWLLGKPYITAPIIGANSVDQLRESLGVVGFRLPPEDMAYLDEVSDWRKA